MICTRLSVIPRDNSRLIFFEYYFSLSSFLERACCERLEVFAALYDHSAVDFEDVLAAMNFEVCEIIFLEKPTTD